VRISDSALVAAATLSHRYITDRFLPDKAIDLMDEAASPAADGGGFSKPEELDALDRQILQMQIEAEALKKETTRPPRTGWRSWRRSCPDLQRNRRDDRASGRPSATSWPARASIKEQLDRARAELTQAKREGDLAKAGELSYGVIPELEKQLAEAAEARRRRHGRGGRAPEQIAPWSSAGPAFRSTRCWRASARSCCDGEELGKRVIGQKAGGARRVERRAPGAGGLQDENRPLGSFLFLGPDRRRQDRADQGAGRVPVRRRQAMVRIDMSEFMEKHSVARLIGAPPGYVGYDEGGVLTEAVRRRPYQVILFDEVEKAHPDVFNVLLQVLDDGRLTDGQGRTVDFKQTLIVLTSNLGSQALSQLPDGARMPRRRSAT
jgi:ATP-dependent Clp protease ATP-binding subunit ClpB